MKRDLTGKVFNRLTVIAYRPGANRRGVKQVCPKWECLCSCGNTTFVSGYELIHNRTKSCGCFKKEADRASGWKGFTHGRTVGRKQDPLYRKWAAVKERCTNPNYKYWDRYGGRGITMFQEWSDSPQAFFDYMGEKPFEKAEIDRINNDGNYEPGNVRWATHKENMRNTSNRVEYEYHGERKTVSEWADFWGLPYDTVRSRIRRGWSESKILSKPTQPYKRKE